ncbi:MULTISPECIES: hypothetical protein [unclassified Synechococcus]|uniref:hypothetical protein n=1 Tax=unclassified Synechococcus TaxID=2626047 RepID=UPI0039AF763A
MARRPRKSAKAEAESEVLQRGRWSGLREHQAPQAKHHSAAENDEAHRRCKQFLSGGVDAVDWATRKRHPEQQQRQGRRQYP